MGVFDSIKDRFDGDEETDEEQAAEASAQETGDDAASESGGDAGAGVTATDSEEAGTESDETDDEGSEPVGSAEELQTHADHWGAVVPPEGSGEAVEEFIEGAAENGELIEGEDLDGDAVAGHRDQDGPLGTMAVSVDQEVVTGYPIAEGVEQTFEVEQVGEWDSGVEGWLLGACGPATLSPFATNYFELDEDELGDEQTASLAVVTYRIGEAAEDTVETEDGEEIDVSDFAGVRPWNEGGPDEYVLRTTVESVEEIDFGEYEAYRIEAPLLRPEDGEQIDAAFYVGEHVAGEYEPEEGDAIEGIGWLQAEFL